ncbi:amino acid adenylation domain-containing protein [Streptomyces uncialis]|uniref:non-ribosomal peptide synthetase n=1 Tax=Streptomyces uncialis TaxID=1048205 RepID=UPI002E36C6F8|nr:non-ribosomal peptide synthetase [Streptomyces uncialis]
MLKSSHTDDASSAPLSPTQHAIWVACRADPDAPVYRAAECVQVEGPLDRALFEQALRRTVDDVDSLRARFVETADGPRQLIGALPPWEPAWLDFRSQPDPRAAVDEWIRKDLARLIDLAADRLFTFAVFRIAEHTYLWYQGYHHIVIDGVGFALLNQRFAEAYNALTDGLAVPAASIGSVRSLVDDHEEYARSSQFLEDQAYWWDRFADLPEPGRLAGEPPTGWTVPVRRRAALPERSLDALRDARQRHGARTSRLMFAAAAVLVHRHSGAGDVVLGLPVTARVTETAKTAAGPLVNVLPLRLSVRPQTPVRELVEQVGAEIRAALAHQRYPGERLRQELRARGMGRSVWGPAVNVIPFHYGGRLGGARMVTSRNMSVRHIHDMSFSAYRRADGGLDIDLDADPRLYTDGEVAGHHEAFGQLVGEITEALDHPGRTIADLSTVGRERREALNGWGRPAGPPVPARTFSDLFREVAARHGDAPAVELAGAPCVGYTELDERADALAGLLLARGVGPESLVAVALPRSVDLVVAVLAVMRAGGAYLPVDPAYPRDRIVRMLADARPQCLLTVEGLAEQAGTEDTPVLLLDAPATREELSGTARASSGAAPAVAPDVRNTAYVIYTSGSTGVPKGVAVTHQGVAALAQAQQRAFRVGPGSRVLQFASISFDAAFWELAMALLSGGTLILAPHPDELLPPELGRLLSERRITHVTLPPAVLAALPDGAIPEGVTLAVAGEVCPLELVDTWSPGRKMINAYGPTETTVCCTTSEPLSGGTGSPVPIGSPFALSGIHVLDHALQPVQPGVAGEVYVTGPGLARGYLGRAGLTAERFVANPFTGDGDRMYRTGDLARWREDGRLEFIGRADQQVKIRGFRVELGEIESVLLASDGVRQAVAVLRTEGVREPQIVAYVVPEGTAALDVDAAHGRLAETLPAHMRPHAILELGALPVTPQGKVDRAALPAPSRTGGTTATDHGFVSPPLTPRERQLCALFAEILDIDADTVGIDRSFFEMGGHSLLAGQLVVRIRAELGAHCGMETVFLAPTVRELAERLGDRRAGSDDDPVRRGPVPALRDGDLELSFAQRRLWFLQQLEGPSTAYNIPLVLSLGGELDQSALAAALGDVVDRHETLRTLYQDRAGRPVRRILAEGGPAHPGLAVVATDDSRLRERLTEAAADTFDLSAEPPLRAVLFALDPGRHVLLLLLHHVAADAESLGPLMRDLLAAYEARRAGQVPALTPLPLQYADYTAWQRRMLGDEADPDSVSARQIAFWQKALAGLPDHLDLPFDRPHPAGVRTAPAAVTEIDLDPALHSRVVGLARSADASTFMVLQAALAALLTRLGAGDDIAVGAAVAGRSHTSLADLVGLFVNTVVLRTDTSGNPSFRELLGRVRRANAAAYGHQDLPFERLVEALKPPRSMSRHPLFQVMLSMDSSRRVLPSVAGLELELTGMPTGTAKFDLSFNVREAFTAEGDADGIRASLEYRADVFRPDTARALLERYVRLIEAVTQDPGTRIGDARILADDEHHRLLHDWNRTEAPHTLDDVVARVSAMADRRPDSVAVTDDDGDVTYRELVARMELVASRLRAHGAGPDTVVGVLADRSRWAVTAFLGVLAAGAAYLPLETGAPASRSAALLTDAGTRWLLADPRHGDLAAAVAKGAAGTVAVLELTGDGVEPIGGTRVTPAPDQLAYVIFTSGSTGRPKGAMVHHRGMNNHLLAKVESLTLTAEDTIVLNAPLTFDISLWQMVAALLVGSRTLAVGPDLAADPTGLFRSVARQGVTVLEVVPSLLRAVLEAWDDGTRVPPLPKLRWLVVTGEELPAELSRRWHARFPDIPVVNAYGPTECSDDVTHAIVAQPPTRTTAPIGRAIRNTRLYVLSDELQPVPVGVVGDLYVAGTGVGRGYLGDPAKTAGTFVADPFTADGGRLYRTGDRVRFLPDGQLEFLGRRDTQVKIRGRRIELGEVEAQMRAQPGVTDAVASVVTGLGGHPRLVGYIVGSQDTRAVREALSAQLPDHLVPSAVMALDAIPLTPNGKTDRKALPVPEMPGALSRAPGTPQEEILCGLFADVLGVDRVGTDASFFDLGGHSLLATRLVSRIRVKLGVEITLATLFRAPTPAGLARRLPGAGPARPALVRQTRPGVLPLSPGQQRLWFLHHLRPDSTEYHVPVVLDIEGPLDSAALAAALEDVVQRHEVLRTLYPADGPEPHQHVLPFAELRLELQETPVEQLSELVQARVDRPFSLATEPPVRAALLSTPGAEVLVLVLHHIAFDGWSLDVFLRDLDTAYRSRSAGQEPGWEPLPVQYADHALAQRQLLRDTSDAGGVLKDQLGFWHVALADLPEEVTLPTDRPRPAAPDFAGDIVPLGLDGQVWDGVRKLARTSGATVFMVLHAALTALLSRLGAGDDVPVGTVVAGRGDELLDDLVGFFGNTVTLRVSTAGNPPFADLLDRTRTADLAAFAHQDVPFEQVVEELNPRRSLSHHPLFQVMLALQDTPQAEPALGGLTMRRRFAGLGRAKFDLSFLLRSADDGLTGGVEYATELYDRSTVESLVTALRRVLTAVVADPGVRLGDIDLLGARERTDLVRHRNDTRHPVPYETVVEAFRAQAAKTPDAIAVSAPDAVLTYRDLDARTDRLAGMLTHRGAGPERFVAILLPRGAEQIVAVLAVLKSGAGYLPLDVDHPAERLQAVVGSARPVVAMTTALLAHRLPLPTLLVDQDPPGTAAPVPAPPRPGHPAYVIHTSGSTGTPKGVVIEHRALAHYVAWAAMSYPGVGDRTLLHSPITFDMPVTTLFAPLVSGGRIDVGDLETGPTPDRGYSLLKMTPTHLAMLGEPHPQFAAGCDLVVGGEQLPAELAEAWLSRVPGMTIHNEYGPTEVTVGCVRFSASSSTRLPAGGVPIGRPVWNTAVYVLDAWLNPVPVGVTGELYVSGAGLARGYLGAAGATAERFVADPWAQGRRMYRSGDLVRWTADGLLTFHGRADDQVKIRGFRVEPGEVEAVLGRHPVVSRAVVIAREQDLVAYVSATSAVTPGDLRAWAAQMLPAHLVPALFVVLAELPTTTSGKVDRRALPEASARGSGGALGDPVVEVLAGVFGEVLGAEQVGADDDFFDLGGHSLSLLRLVNRIRTVFGREVPARAVFEHPTVRSLAALLTGARDARPALRRGPRPQRVPLSSAQRRLWFLNRMNPEDWSYNVPLLLDLEGTLAPTALEAALADVVQRHEPLRTVLPGDDGEPWQEVLSGPEALPGIVTLEVTPEEVARKTEDAQRYAFDLAAEPPLRVWLLSTAPDRHRLLLLLHHVAVDGMSIGPLLRDLDEAYRARYAGRAPQWQPLAVDYADYAMWQRDMLDDPDTDSARNQGVAFWRSALAGLPHDLPLPVDRPRPAVPGLTGGVVPFTVDASRWGQIRSLARSCGASVFMVLHAAVTALLSRLAAGDDVPVGTPVAGRGDEALDGLVGFFVNTVVLRVSTAGNPSFAELVERTRESDLAAFTHQDVPFEQVVDEVNPARSLSRHPLFQVMVTLQNAPEAMAGLGDLTVSRTVPDITAAKVDLAFGFTDDADEGCRGAVQYSADLFDRSTVERLAAMLDRLLRAVVAEPGRAIADHDLLGPQDRDLLSRHGSGVRNGVAGLSITDAFAAQQARTPDAVAVTDGADALTYRQLDRKAELLADRLAELGVTAETNVAVLLERSRDLVVSALAVLKAGGTYVPFEPEDAPVRVGALARQADAVLLLTHTRLRDHDTVRDSWVPVVFADAHSRAGAPRRRRARRPAQLAYVMHTSGSTGTPKGVGISDASVVALAADRWWSHGAAERVLMHTSPAFDPATFELWVPLLTGGCSVVAPWRRHPEPHLLARAVAEHGITGVALSAAVFEALATADPSCLRGLQEVWTGGESMSPQATARVREAAPGTRLTNSYGPTETTFAVVQHTVDADGPAGRVPIGRPMDNVRCHVLDDRLRPVPLGVPGELYVAGPGLARGYLAQPGGSAERFVADPFGAPGERMYRTGDRVRFRPDGELEFLARTDQQMKIRGHRVEPGEIEAALAACPDIARAAVVVRQDRLGVPVLVGYVVPEPGGPAPSAEALRSRLAALLPTPMVPAAFVELAELPLTRNGKVDRRALPAPAQDPGPAAVRPPRNRTETVLCEAVAELLRLEQVGIDDNLFDLGGDSILFIQLVSRMRTAGLLLGVRDVFTHQTVADLARVARPVAEHRDVSDESASGVLPPTPIMHWLRELGGPVEAFNQSMTVRVPASVNRARLEEALQTLLDRHDMLRARLHSDWTLEVPEPGACRAAPLLRRADATTADESVRAAEGAAACARLDPWNGVMLQAVWFDAGPARPGRLLLVIHHLVVDGVSWRILLPDLAAAYRAAEAGRAAAPAPVTSSFRGWARRLSAAAQDPQRLEELPWWRRTSAAGPGLFGEDGPVPDRDTFADLGRLRTTVPTELTSAILGEVSAALNLRVDEVLLSALALAAGEWRRRRRLPGQGVLVDVEAHGRDLSGGMEGMDLSRTVGWFTRMHPVRLDPGTVPPQDLRTGGHAVERAARRVKEQLRGCPDGGAGYGLLRYLTPDGTGEALTRRRAEIGFNYLGRFEVSDEADWLPTADPVPVPAADPRMPVPHTLELTVVCTDLLRGPEFAVTWSWARALLGEQQAADFASLWNETLAALCARACAGGKAGRTPSDVPLVSLNQEELDLLEEKWSF